MKRLLIVTAVDAEARAIGAIGGAEIIAGGVGRTNAAAATTEAIVRRGRFDAVLSAGVAGALPGSGLAVGNPILASRCIYCEEGMAGPGGFSDVAGIGLSLGPFEGNAVPVDEQLLEALGAIFPMGPLATVATCSGSDAAAGEVVRRTGALAEAMEGAAVVHAALRLRTPAIELRTISNTTGDRPSQIWDLPLALRALGEAVRRAVDALRGHSSNPRRN